MTRRTVLFTFNTMVLLVAGCAPGSADIDAALRDFLQDFARQLAAAFVL